MELTQHKMGVLSDNQLLTYDFATKQKHHYVIDSTEVWTLSDVLAGAHHYGIDTLWIAPGSSISKIARQLLQQAVYETYQLYASQTRDNTPRFMMIYRKSGNTKSVKFAFPEHDSRWPWQHVTDAETLFHSILFLQDALQHEIAWSPGHTGQEILIDLNKKHPEWLKPFDVPEVMRNHPAQDMRWHRPLTAQEAKPGMWLHLFDASGKYLAACTGINCGEGTPDHLTLENIYFKPRWPGIWNVEGLGWLWTPEVEFHFADLDDKPRPKIKEAWYWPENRYHETVRSFGVHMWNARLSLRPDPFLPGHDEAYNLAYDAFKNIYTQGLGWLDMPGRQEDNKLYRPDIYSMIISGARRSVLFKMRKLAKAGFPVCWVEVDTIGVISDGESASVEEFRRLILDREGEKGGYRLVGSVQLTPELIEAFAVQSKHPTSDHSKVKKVIDEYLKEKGMK